HTAKEGKGMRMAAQPGFDFLVPNKFDVLVATPGEGHHKGPRPPWVTARRVEEKTGITEVHLGFLAWLGFNTHGHVRLLRFQPAHEAVDRAVAARVALLLQPLPDGRNFH